MIAFTICRMSLAHSTFRQRATPTCLRTSSLQSGSGLCESTRPSNPSTLLHNCQQTRCRPARTVKTALPSPWSLMPPYAACAPNPREPATWHAHIDPARPLGARDTSRTHQLRGTPPALSGVQAIPTQSSYNLNPTHSDGIRAMHTFHPILSPPVPPPFLMFLLCGMTSFIPNHTITSSVSVSPAKPPSSSSSSKVSAALAPSGHAARARAGTNEAKHGRQRQCHAR
ncbi:hypothetical protein OH77DRAFT_1216145 [Trametes cingulata]|nr:hypothetical protein OH77DRAFT_1216145 [Trametes cingulata]